MAKFCASHVVALQTFCLVSRLKACSSIVDILSLVSLRDAENKQSGRDMSASTLNHKEFA